MSLIICGNDENRLFLTSGMKFAELTENGIFAPIEIPFPPVEESTENGRPAQPQPPPKNPPRILCGCISADGSKAGFADDLKQATIWARNPDGIWTMTKRIKLEKRATKILFTKEDDLIIADKSGDCYLNDRFLLGHLSMLLDASLAAERYLITCDRDEKIRVSNFPNTYNIHGYCLGHSDFVCGVHPLEHPYLVSASGDGTLKKWDFLTGREIWSRNCADDLPDLGDGDRNLPVRAMSCREAKNRRSFIAAVILEGFDGILIYEMDRGGSGIKAAQIIPFEEPAFDTVVTGSKVHVLLKRCEKVEERIRSFGFSLEEDKFVAEKLNFLRDEKSVRDFLRESENVESGIEELNKRQFDNVKEYLEKKTERINNKKSKA